MSVTVRLLKSIQSKFNYLPRATLSDADEWLTRFPPVFILGAPRSGSTLAYQVVVGTTNCSFLTNLMAIAPRFLVCLSTFKGSADAELKESDLGYIPGLLSPNEGGAIFRKWFSPDLCREDKGRIRSLVASLSKKHGEPFVTKNLFNVFRLEQIMSVFPEAKVIWVSRDPCFNAQSIYKARQKVSPTQLESWWSVEPPEYEQQLSKSPVDQIIWQLEQVELVRKEMLHKLDAYNLLEINYSDLCGASNKLIETIVSFVGGERDMESFGTLSSRDKVTVDDEIWCDIRSKVESSDLFS